MLTPAIQAYGVVGLSIVIAILVASIVALVLDSRRWVREHADRAEAKRRHPAGHLRSVETDPAPLWRIPDTFRPVSADDDTVQLRPVGGRHRRRIMSDRTTPRERWAR